MIRLLKSIWPASNNQSQRIVRAYVASGSGGHIHPIITRAHTWRAENPLHEVIIFCTNNTIDAAIIKKHALNIVIIKLRLTKPPRLRHWWRFPVFFSYIFTAFLQSIYYLWHYKPDVIESTGGFVTIPLFFAARFLRIKRILYQLDVVPGKAIIFLSSWVTKLYVVFKESYDEWLGRGFDHARCELASYPLRFSSHQSFDRLKTIERINIIKKDNQDLFTNDRPTIFIIGGSQGSLFLNQLFCAWLMENKSRYSSLQIIHQTVHEEVDQLVQFYKELKLPAFVFSYYEELAPIYTLADIVITRAGAGTLFELEFFKKNAIIIPLRAHTTTHQVNNAHAMVNRNIERFKLIDATLCDQALPLFTQYMNESLLSNTQVTSYLEQRDYL